jgi:hypothetical protein
VWDEEIAMKTAFRDTFKLMLAAALVMGSAATAAAAPISYDVSITTAGMGAGSIWFGLTRGAADTTPATAIVTSFASPGGSLGAASSSGDVTGALPGAVTFGPAAGSHSFSQGITFGSLTSFVLTFDGNAASSFNIGFSSAGGGTPGAIALIVDPTGIAGSFVIPGPNGEPAPTFSITPTAAVPEPGTLLLISSGVLGLVARRRRLKPAGRKA